ncbi:MAG TPA: hypothetical protein VK206_15605 [Anaerolineales bacterium]|nr:hypothetical protein [Anaerolineales bacterium]HLO34364.1 hypothetical protein [Anaerolineales bacterium]
MKFSRRMIVSILLMVLVLLFGIFFWPFVLNQIITPIALTAWLFLRIFVLSINQNYYWGAIIFVIAVLLFRQLFDVPATNPPGHIPDVNDTVRTIEYWHSMFTLASPSPYDNPALKRELIHLVASLYASKERSSPSFIFYDALQRGEIPLPDHIHTFLFPNEQKESTRSFTRLMRSVREAPRKWIRCWTGQETKEYHRTIDEILSFMETSLEIENGDGKFTQNEH